MRRATEDDVEGLIELNAGGHGDTVGVQLRCAFGTKGLVPGDFAVVCDGTRAVATIGLMRVKLRLAGVEIPAGQPEFVVTDPDYQRRGLARDLMGLVHTWSAESGDLVQIVAGIPYFYRQFGYQYGLVRPRERLVAPESDLGDTGEWETRRATVDDIPAMRALEEAVQSRVDLSLPYPDEIWPVLAGLPPAEELAVAVRDNAVGAVARILAPEGPPVHVQALAAGEVSAARALLHRARRRCPGTALVVAERPGSVVPAALPAASPPVPRRKWLYLRIPDLAALLAHLRPVLSHRLSQSCLSQESGRTVISLYGSSVELRFDRGAVLSVSPGPGGAPADPSGTSHVPPDLTAALVFGEDGVTGLEHHPDVSLRRDRALLGVLFPPLRIDALIW